MDNVMNTAAEIGACVQMRGGVCEDLMVEGTYRVECIRDGKVVWEDSFLNTVVTVGKNHMLDNYLAGSAFTQVGPFMGLISSASFSAIAAGDTMASHAGWLEAGTTNAPTMSANRITMNGGFSAASAGSKALTSALSFSITGTGTLKGAFAVLGSGAVVTAMSTAGTLFSAGLFSGGDRAVLSGDTVNVSYSCAV